jgi:hypothetical protein
VSDDDDDDDDENVPITQMRMTALSTAATAALETLDRERTDSEASDDEDVVIMQRPATTSPSEMVDVENEARESAEMTDNVAKADDDGDDAPDNSTDDDEEDESYEPTRSDDAQKEKDAAEADEPEGERDNATDSEEEGDAAAASSSASLPPFALIPEQVPVVEKMVNSCQRFGRFMNESAPGLGKTIMTPTGVAIMDKWLLAAGLAGNGMGQKWESASRRQGAKWLGYISWNKLCGSRRKIKDVSLLVDGYRVETPLRHHYLLRFDTYHCATTAKGKPYWTTRFEATPLLRAKVAEGLCIVADEIHKAKNASLSNQALSTMVAVIFQGKMDLHNPEMMAGNGGSCVVGLSATTMDNPAQAKNLVRALGLVWADTEAFFNIEHNFGRDKTYEPTNDSVRWFLKMCEKRNPEAYWDAKRKLLLQLDEPRIRVHKETGQVLGSEEMNVDPRLVFSLKVTLQDRLDWFVYLLYTSILSVDIAGAAQRIPDPSVVIDCKSIVYKMANDDASDTLQRYLTELAELTGRGDNQKNTRAEEQRKNDLLMEIEKLKADIFVAKADETLNANPRAQVLVVLFYTAAINSVHALLQSKGHEVAIIDGKTDPEERVEIIKRFQAGTLRCIVGQLIAISSGIDLHDTEPIPERQRPRFTFMAPSPFVADLYQVMNRTNRIGVKGTVTITMIFGSAEAVEKKDKRTGAVSGVRLQLADEVKIMRKMTKRSMILKSVARQSVADGAIFPSDMDVYEDENGVLKKRDRITLDGDDGDDEDRPRQRKKKGGDDDGKPEDPRKRGRTTLEAVPTRTWKEIAKAIGPDLYGSFQPGDLVWINKNVRSRERGALRKPGMVVSRTRIQYDVKSIFSNGEFAADPHSIDETHAAGMEFATKWPKSASIPVIPTISSTKLLPMQQFLTLPTRYEIKKYAYLWEYWTRANPAFQQDRGPAPDAATDQAASSSASGQKGTIKKTSVKKSKTPVISSAPVSVRESASASMLAPQSRVAPSLPPLVPLATGAPKPRDVDFSRVDFLQPTMGRSIPAAAAASSSSSSAAAAAARSPAALPNRSTSTSRPGGEDRSVVQEYMDSLRAYGLDVRTASSSLHGHARKSR